MAARFPRGKQPEFPVHFIRTRKLSNLIYYTLFIITTTAGKHPLIVGIVLYSLIVGIVLYSLIVGIVLYPLIVGIVLL